MSDWVLVQKYQIQFIVILVVFNCQVRLIEEKCPMKCSRQWFFSMLFLETTIAKIINSVFVCLFSHRFQKQDIKFSFKFLERKWFREKLSKGRTVKFSQLLTFRWNFRHSKSIQSWVFHILQEFFFENMFFLNESLIVINENRLIFGNLWRIG